MSRRESEFLLPPKIDAYLATLNRIYASRNETALREIVVNSTVTVHEQSDYDNWNGGTYYHAVTLTVAESDYVQIMDQKDELQKVICDDLNKLANTPNEHIGEVNIEMEPVGNDSWREETGVYRPRASNPAIAPDALQRIWGSGHVRVFLSHKSTVKEGTAKIKEALSRCGISAFVAHEDIEPTEEWQREIERALFSMDALVALLSDDFHESNWTDQEVGVAIGRGVPLIAVRLGRDPYGLMGKNQGLGGCSWSDPNGIAVKVFHLLHKRLPDKTRLFECALSAYARSGSFADSAWKVEYLMSVFENLGEDQVRRLVCAFGANEQNVHSYRGKDLLLSLLKKWTGEKWEVQDNELQPVTIKSKPEIPF